MNEITVVIPCERIDRLTEQAIESVGEKATICLVVTEQLGNIRSSGRLNIVKVAFKQDFSALKNAGLERVTTPWVFYLDSDEVMTNEMWGEINAIIAHPNPDFHGYWIPRKTYVTKDTYLAHGFFYPDYQLRLFRADKNYRFTGTIHEQVSIPFEKTAKLTSPLIHHPRYPKYTSFSDWKNFQEYITIHAKELKRQPAPRFGYTIHGLWQGVWLFSSGYFRGKGFLDGWAGFRAHLLFAASIASAYIKAGKPQL